MTHPPSGPSTPPPPPGPKDTLAVVPHAGRQAVLLAGGRRPMSPRTWRYIIAAELALLATAAALITAGLATAWFGYGYALLPFGGMWAVTTLAGQLARPATHPTGPGHPGPDPTPMPGPVRAHDSAAATAMATAERSPARHSPAHTGPGTTQERPRRSPRVRPSPG